MKPFIKNVVELLKNVVSEMIASITLILLQIQTIETGTPLATWLIWIVILALVGFTIYRVIQLSKKWNEEERITAIVKNRWDERLRENPFPNRIALESQRQNLLDEILDELMKTTFYTRSRAEVEKIAKEKSLIGFEIGHGGYPL